jgi:hypothetical protein
MTKPGESRSAAAGRMEQARKLEREIAVLERGSPLTLRTAALADLVTTKTEDARGQAEDALARSDRTERRQDR